jgi:class 3 adenylate cyclase/DNA-binding transcriptional MerR regulator
MSEELTLRDLSQRSGQPPERLEEWRSLGLIGRGDAEAFGPEDVKRARLIRLLLRRGVSLEEIARAERRDGFLARYVDEVFPGGFQPACSLREASERLGSDLDAMRRLLAASGLAEEGEPLHEEDVQALQAMKVALEAGFPEEALIQLMRVYVDALGRVAEAEVRLFHFYVHERLKAQGLSGRELIEADVGARDRMIPLIEPLILYFHHKGFERARVDDAVMHLQEDLGSPEKAEVPGQLSLAILFVDLSSFTPLAEAMGDQAAARVLDRFSQLVREAVSRREGRVVKQLGDAFMLVFPEPGPAVACALEIEERTAAEPQFPAARAGVHWGPVLYREGDYLGTSVNVAARLADEAQRHQVLATAAVRREASGLPDVEFVPIGKRRLKGLTEELELFEVRAGAVGRTGERLVDPVCGMELGADEVAATLSFEGRDRGFCSQECLRRFVATPARYGAEAP